MAPRGPNIALDWCLTYYADFDRKKTCFIKVDIIRHLKHTLMMSMGLILLLSFTNFITIYSNCMSCILHKIQMTDLTKDMQSAPSRPKIKDIDA